MATKYIVNNVTGQTINGDLTINGEIISTGQTINGNLSINGEITSTGQTINGDLTINGNVTISGTSTTNGVATYRALLTQTGPITGTINTFGQLIIGETYTITNYVEDADFSNVADVQSGTINQTGCVFIATGTTPNSWSDGTDLTSNGELIVDVLENTLGYDISWQQAPFGGYGYYIGVNDTTGPLINSFPKNKVSIIGQSTIPFDSESPGINILPSIGGFMVSNSSLIEINVFDYFLVYM